MRQIERWYDVKVVFDGPIPKESINGEIGRDLTLAQLLNGINGMVAKFRLEGRVLHVLP